jgi:hypothetical protein
MKSSPAGRHARGAGFASMALVAVNDSAGFWRRHGFRETHDASLDRKLASYDDAARYMVRDLATDEGRTRMSAEDKLKELGLTLPDVPTPVATYVSFKQVGDIVYLSGQGPKRATAPIRPARSARTSRSRKPMSTPSRPASACSRR